MAGLADELKRIPMSEALAATLTQATDYADAQGRGEVALEHLLLALTEDDDASQVLSASHVDSALLKADVSQYLGGLEFHAPSGLAGGRAGPITLAVDLRRILEAAAAAASQGRRHEINGAIVLAAIVGDGRSSAAHMLRAQGLTFEEAIKALQRALAQPSAVRPQRVAVRAGPAKPEAEDIIATARARVQTRASPGVPPLVAKTAVRPPELSETGRVVAVDTGSIDGALATRTEAAVASWPPPVRSSLVAASDFPPLVDIAGHGAISTPDERGEPQDQTAYQAAVAGAYTSPAPVSAVPETGLAPTPPPRQTPLGQRAGPPRRPAAPPLGTRWPAPVAPAWRDQEIGQFGPSAGNAPPPLPNTSYSDGTYSNVTAAGPPPLPTEPSARQADELGDQRVGFSSDREGQTGSYDRAPSHDDPAEQTGVWGESANGSANGVWRDGDADALAEATYPPSVAGDVVAPDMWISADQTAEWPTEAYQHGPPVELAPKSALPPAPRVVKRRKSSERAVSGQMSETIPRRMRKGVASLVEIRLGMADFLGLADGLQGEDSTARPLALAAAMSVSLGTPEDGFNVALGSPQTQWLTVVSNPSMQDFASWQWTVTPLKAGSQRLQMAISVRTLAPDGTPTVTTLPEQTLQVRVGRNYGRGVMKLAGWFMLALSGWMVAKYANPIVNPLIAEVLKALK